MKRLDASLVSLVGFAASQWAEQQANNGSSHKRRLRQLVAAGLEIHTRSEIYAAAPALLRSLQTVAAHASIAMEITNGHEMPEMRSQDNGQDDGRRNGKQRRQGHGTK